MCSRITPHATVRVSDFVSKNGKPQGGKALSSPPWCELGVSDSLESRSAWNARIQSRYNHPLDDWFCDGLRADKAFQFFPDPSKPTNDSSVKDVVPMAPFLRSRVLNHGTFGVSHTRVPTESRPGHVALIAGLYEDVAAVTTGWNSTQLTSTASLIEASIPGAGEVQIFPAGAVPGRVEDQMYEAEFEDYSKDATELDYWVFDRIKKLFKDANTDKKLNAKLRQDIIVFFLPLLDLDTTGHAHRPYSQEYLRNIQIVDQGVQEITEIIDRFYGDDKTAFIFTADHGMSDWGSHGDGHPDNTRTPLIAWGSGVAKPRTVKSGKAPGHEDGFSGDWQLGHVYRHDVAQADIAALMAYLAGLEFPVNSPYPGFAETNIEKRLAAIEELIREQDYRAAMKQSDELSKIALQGLRYLQTYAWLSLRTLVTAGYLGWIAFAFTTAVDVYMLDGKTDSALFQASPITYYAYALFPVLLWEEVLARTMALAEGRKKLFSQFSKTDTVKFAMNAVACLALLEVMVQSYYNRQVYTIVYLAAAAWPLIYGTDFVKSDFSALHGHFLASVGGILIFLIGVLYIVIEKRLLVQTIPSKDGQGTADSNGVSKLITGLQVRLVALAILVTRSSVS
ncbi:hypothetical protein GTR04_6802 [Trichophyton interdigitale]|nr:hypothetical protein GY632_6621 [Trichophyton interdigitale]KAG8205817.1 hypothetical protein GTR04_6802 [Trichophyton interdigitale]